MRTYTPAVVQAAELILNTSRPEDIKRKPLVAAANIVAVASGLSTFNNETKAEILERTEGWARNIRATDNREFNTESQARRREEWPLDNARTVVALEGKLATWAEEFIKAPAHAFRWVDGPMETAADHAVRFEVDRILFNYPEGRPGPRIRSKVTLEQVVDYLEEQVLRKVRYVSLSTSVGANHMERCTTASQLKVAEKIRSAIGYFPDNNRRVL